MGISLFQHNREAYESAFFMLSEKEKSAMYSCNLENRITTRHRVRASEQYLQFDENRMERINQIFMHWNSYLDISWEQFYTAAKEHDKKRIFCRCECRHFRARFMPAVR